MNALRQSSLDYFQGKTFYGSASQYEVITCTSGRTKQTQSTTNDVTIPEIQSMAHSDVDSLLVKVLFDASTEPMRFHSSVFECQRLFAILRIDPYGLGLVATDMTGFYHLGGDTATGSSSYYFQCFAYKLVWSYDHHHNTTRAIAFVKNTEHGLLAFADFLRTAKVNQELMLHPLYLPLSGITQVMIFMDTSLRRHYDECHIMESTTGLRPWRNSFGGAQTDVHELNDMLQKMSALVVEAEMFIRRAKQWIIAVDAFERLRTRNLESLEIESAQEEAASVWTAIQLIRSKLVMMEIDFNYVRGRAQGQCSAISHTMTRDDMLASIKLASIATRDSSSMKAIAIMTMAFLPGAFFATLFAVPSLHWNGGNVVGENFWVYWAFVLPSTGLIFVLWGILTQKEELLSIWNLTIGRMSPQSSGDQYPEKSQAWGGIDRRLA